MGLFICDKCKCIENTALGQYWNRNSGIYPEKDDGKALCSECASIYFIDGTKTGAKGKWHNKFPKNHISELTDEEKNNLLNYD